MIFHCESLSGQMVCITPHACLMEDKLLPVKSWRMNRVVEKERIFHEPYGTNVPGESDCQEELVGIDEQELHALFKQIQ